MIRRHEFWKSTFGLWVIIHIFGFTLSLVVTTDCTRHRCISCCANRYKIANHMNQNWQYVWICWDLLFAQTRRSAVGDWDNRRICIKRRQCYKSLYLRWCFINNTLYNYKYLRPFPCISWVNIHYTFDPLRPSDAYICVSILCHRWLR